MLATLLEKTKKVYLLLALVPALVLTACDKDKDEAANPGYVLNRKAVGASARDLLSAEKYGKIIVELQYAQGFEPTSAAVSNLRSWIEKYLNKPGGIILKQSVIPAPGKNFYTAQDLAGIEEKYRKEYTRPDTIAIYFFFADSKYAEDTDNSKVLGVAYRNTSMALFQHTIRSMSGGIGQPDRTKLESVVLQHELGHILGLVNAGTPMQQQHQDAPHGRHCDNNKCLMHYTVETGGVVQNLLGGYTPVLDQNCINDLKSNGGK